MGQPSAPVASQQSRILRADGARDYGEVNKTVKMENETLEKNEPDGMNHTTSEWPVLNRPQVAGFDSPDDMEWYVRMPVFWRLFGKQFLVIARKSP